MITQRVARRFAMASAIALALPLAAACAASGHRQSNIATIKTAATTASPSKHSLLHPKRKYYGIFVNGAPASMAPINSIKNETGKKPNLDVWYQAWGAGARHGEVNFYSAGAKALCKAGILPMYTWESWDPSSDNSAYAQQSFATKKIIDGDFDAYIRNTADAIRAIHCPIAVRFDQEQNGYWYPWGLTTAGMGSLKDTPKQYVEAWRHVWRIFHNQHANNVLWTWSPNYQGLSHPKLPSLKATYPGKKYVDWVGIDGYYFNNPNQTFAHLFNPTIHQIKPFASGKPWIIAETGVGSSSKKPKQIANLLKSVAHRKQFNGFVYFDYHQAGTRAYWPFQQTAASLRAFKAGIASKRYGAAKPGSL